MPRPRSNEIITHSHFYIIIKGVPLVQFICMKTLRLTFGIYFPWFIAHNLSNFIMYRKNWSEMSSFFNGVNKLWGPKSQGLLFLFILVSSRWWRVTSDCTNIPNYIHTTFIMFFPLVIFWIIRKCHNSSVSFSGCCR